MVTMTTMTDNNEEAQHTGGLPGIAHSLIGAVEGVEDALLPEGAQDVTHALNDMAGTMVEGVADVGDAVVDSAQEAVLGTSGDENENETGGDQQQGQQGAAA